GRHRRRPPGCLATQHGEHRPDPPKLLLTVASAGQRDDVENGARLGRRPERDPEVVLRRVAAPRGAFGDVQYDGVRRAYGLSAQVARSARKARLFQPAGDADGESVAVQVFVVESHGRVLLW